MNLPDTVQPFVVYRDIGIVLRISSVFSDIDRIVAVALGEMNTDEATEPKSSTPGERQP